MRPRTLARKQLKPLFNLFNDEGDCIAPCGLSYQQKAIARAQQAVERSVDDSLIVCALLYDLDELLMLSHASSASSHIRMINKDKHAAEFLKMVFSDHIIKPIRLKTVAQQYSEPPICIEPGTATLFEESPWFFLSMSLYQIEKKITTNVNPHLKIHSEIISYEELLLSQTLILINKEKQHA